MNWIHPLTLLPSNTNNDFEIRKIPTWFSLIQKYGFPYKYLCSNNWNSCSCFSHYTKNIELEIYDKVSLRHEQKNLYYGISVMNQFSGKWMEYLACDMTVYFLFIIYHPLELACVDCFILVGSGNKIKVLR